MADEIQTFSYKAPPKKKKRKPPPEKQNPDEKKDGEKKPEEKKPPKSPEEDEELAREKKRREESVRRAEILKKWKKDESRGRGRGRARGRGRPPGRGGPPGRGRGAPPGDRPPPGSGSEDRGRGRGRGRGGSARGRGRGAPAPRGRGARRVGTVSSKPPLESIQEARESRASTRQAWSRPTTTKQKPPTPKEEPKVEEPKPEPEERPKEEEKPKEPEMKPEEKKKARGFFSKWFGKKADPKPEPKPEPPEEKKEEEVKEPEPPKEEENPVEEETKEEPTKEEETQKEETPPPEEEPKPEEKEEEKAPEPESEPVPEPGPKPVVPEKAETKEICTQTEEIVEEKKEEAPPADPPQEEPLPEVPPEEPQKEEPPPPPVEEQKLPEIVEEEEPPVVEESEEVKEKQRGILSTLFGRRKSVFSIKSQGSKTNLRSPSMANINASRVSLQPSVKNPNASQVSLQPSMKSAKAADDAETGNQNQQEEKKGWGKLKSFLKGDKPEEKAVTPPPPPPPEPPPKDPTPPPPKEPTPEPAKEPTPPPSPPKEEPQKPQVTAAIDDTTGGTSNEPPKDASNRPIVIINASPGDAEFQKTLINALGGSLPAGDDDGQQQNRQVGMNGMQPGMYGMPPMMMPYMMPPPPMPYYGMNPYYGPQMPPPPPQQQYQRQYQPYEQPPPPRERPYEPLNRQQREFIQDMPMSSAIPPPKRRDRKVLSPTAQLIETNPGRLLQQPAAQPEWTKKEGSKATRDEIRFKVRKKLHESLKDVEENAQLSDEKFEDSDIDDEFYNATVRKRDRKKKKSLADFNELQKEEMARKAKIAEAERIRKEAEDAEELRRQIAEDGMNELLAMIKGEEFKNDENEDPARIMAEQKYARDNDPDNPAKDDGPMEKMMKAKEELEEEEFRKPFDIDAESPIIFPDEQTYDSFSKLVADVGKHGVDGLPPEKTKGKDAGDRPGKKATRTDSAPSAGDTPSPFSVTIADDLLSMINNSVTPPRSSEKTRDAKSDAPGKSSVSFAPSPKKHQNETQQWLFEAQNKLMEAKRLLSPNSS